MHTLSLTQTAQALGVSERSIYRLMEKGELHPFKQGKFWKFDQDDINAYIGRLKAASTQKFQEKQAKKQESEEQP